MGWPEAAGRLAAGLGQRRVLAGAGDGARRFDWSRIDAEMVKAREHGTGVLLVLGQTPTFHSTRPRAGVVRPAPRRCRPRPAGTATCSGGPAATATVWGGIASFQVWNEANVIGYWSGTASRWRP